MTWWTSISNNENEVCSYVMKMYLLPDWNTFIVDFWIVFPTLPTTDLLEDLNSNFID